MPYISFLVFVVITSFTPGPNNIMAMAFANQYGLGKTIQFCLGVGIGFCTITALSCFFNIALISVMPIITVPLTILGVGYMLYLAFKILTSKENDENSHHTKDNSRSFLLLGAFLQFVNPKGILFGITVVATYILPYYSSFTSYIFFALFLGFVGITSTFSWALFGSVFRKVLIKYRQPFNILMALLLLYSAFSILIH
ncbi:LysE family translocator [Lysinibacillus sp. FSL W8-0992]|uniref:LysE family translocator n=1 Tax=Lysinibacillus sp. FSL W8-0992 TaxID=2954643 RepID=UPI0030F9096C